MASLRASLGLSFFASWLALTASAKVIDPSSLCHSEKVWNKPGVCQEFGVPGSCKEFGLKEGSCSSSGFAYCCLERKCAEPGHQECFRGVKITESWVAEGDCRNCAEPCIGKGELCPATPDPPKLQV
eukprot:TRINITY_DN90603_c0_g1_i1.p1 TRINITY_DN90603_c0_g1~~TRINITY_DN90603_c0_g1_i1.p1  ORF type:complete len:127 (+),score=17.96 TRINITY_DN90603_c0_g1_i1:31-411(+)